MYEGSLRRAPVRTAANEHNKFGQSIVFAPDVALVKREEKNIYRPLTDQEVTLTDERTPRQWPGESVSSQSNNSNNNSSTTANNTKTLPHSRSAAGLATVAKGPTVNTNSNLNAAAYPPVRPATSVSVNGT
jgi:hypothetical protein